MTEPTVSPQLEYDVIWTALRRAGYTVGVNLLGLSPPTMVVDFPCKSLVPGTIRVRFQFRHDNTFVGIDTAFFPKGDK